MSELFEYGFSVEKRCIQPSNSIPPLLITAKGNDCLYDKVMLILNQYKAPFYNRNLQCDLASFIFENDDDKLKEKIAETIYNALTTNIHDATVTNVDVEKDPNQPDVYNVTITFTTKQLKVTIDLSGEKPIVEG